MEPKTRLTVALPTCNGARHLREALRGIRDQQEIGFDWVVSDDRSDDETLAIIGNEVGDLVRVSVNSERLGLAGNWNRCVELSQTDRVAIFHQDDLMLPGHLRAHQSAFDLDPTLGFVASAAVVVDDKGRDLPESVVERGGCGPIDRVYPPFGFVRELGVANSLRCSAVTINAKVHREVGGFDPTYRYVVDWDYWIRVASIRPVAWLSRPTVAIRWHGSSETHRFKTGKADLDETTRLLNSLYGTGGPLASESVKQRIPANRRLAHAYLNRAYDAWKAGDLPLARECLNRSIQLSPAILKTIAFDPKLSVQMAALMLVPGLVTHWRKS